MDTFGKRLVLRSCQPIPRCRFNYANWIGTATFAGGFDHDRPAGCFNHIPCLARCRHPVERERQDHWQGNIFDLEKNWRSAERSYRLAVTPSKVVRHEDIEDELLFCLLGGYGITEEHGRSAWTTVRQLEPFSENWQDDDLFQQIMTTLEFPQFEPRRADGSLRRYRFPKRKSALIVEARRWVRSHKPLEKCLLHWDGPQGPPTDPLGVSRVRT